jgi:regulatory protein
MQINILSIFCKVVVNMEISENKKFITFFIEGEIWKKLDKNLYFSHLEKIRRCRDKKQLSDLLSTIHLQVARSYSCKLLSIRSLFENQLLVKLREKGFEKEVIDETITWCSERGFLDDSKEVENLIRREKERGKGPRVIERALFEKGRKEGVQTFSEEEEKEAIQKVLEKRFPDLSELATKQRAFRFLQRRGFHDSFIRELLFVDF